MWEEAHLASEYSCYTSQRIELLYERYRLQRNGHKEHELKLQYRML